MLWEKIWESNEYKVGIYDFCTKRLYKNTTKPTKMKVEIDGVRWIGNTGSFHIYKYFLADEEAKEIKEIVEKYDEDEVGDVDVDDCIRDIDLTGLGV